MPIEYEIAGEYEDAEKSGKSIEGRIAFHQMMDDIKSGKDAVSYVLVFKLFGFGRKPGKANEMMDLHRMDIRLLMANRKSMRKKQLPSELYLINM